MIIGIVAIAKNFAIGKDGKLPWHYSGDLKFFKETTNGNAVAMGSNTWASIGKPLPNRLNIVLSRSLNIETQPNVVVVHSKDEVAALTKFLNCDLFVIGGAKTFNDFADVIEKWFVTEVSADIEDADTFMPANFLNGFEIVEEKKLDDDLSLKILTRR
ncbi:MAG: dihydrofolate reductase [Acidobacteriota bacterium]